MENLASLRIYKFLGAFFEKSEGKESVPWLETTTRKNLVVVGAKTKEEMCSQEMHQMHPKLLLSLPFAGKGTFLGREAAKRPRKVPFPAHSRQIFTFCIAFFLVNFHCFICEF